MTLKVYKIESNLSANLYAIDVGNKIYNLVLNFDGDETLLNSYLKGGIILFKNQISDLYNPKWLIEYPNNLLIEDDTNYELKKVEKILYDSKVWTSINANEFVYKENEENKLFLSNLVISEAETYEITETIESKIKEILIHVEKIKKLYKADDEVFKNQWFMDYVKSLTEGTENDTNREKNISTYLANIHQLSKDFQINNNHQMKLFFKIFFDVNDNLND